MANFPSGYVRIELYKKNKNIFSYYRDLTHKTTQEDLKKGFDVLEENIISE
jgi:hypothetical protein